MGKHLKGGSGRFYGDGKGTGYRNPPGPKWEKGRSGNPGGGRAPGTSAPEPSGRQRLERAFEKLLSTAVEVGGESLTMTDLLLRGAAKEATSNARVALKLLELYAKTCQHTDVSDEALDDPSEDEELILREATRRLSRPAASGVSDIEEAQEGLGCDD